MSNIVGLFVKSEWRKYWFLNIRQILFLVPIISISLVMSTTQNIKYINQKDFLDNVNYTKIVESEEISNEKNCFEVYKGSLAIVNKVRNVTVFDKYYSCQIFNLIQEEYDLEKTYFTENNMCGYNPLNLKEGEIIISYDMAKKLNVDLNDEIYMMSKDVKLNMLIPYKVKGIMKTKYEYNEIGKSGTAIIKEVSNSKLEKFYHTRKYFTFDGGGCISKAITLKQEKEETNFLNLPVQAVIMVNAVFPSVAFVLIFVIIFREIGRIFKRKRKNFAILLSMGLDKNKIIMILGIMEGIVVCVSSAIALILYKYLFLQKLIGHYVSYALMIKLFVVCVLVGCIAISLNVHFIKVLISRLDIVKLLYNKEND